jgi:hypothetical protein
MEKQKNEQENKSTEQVEYVTPAPTVVCVA